MDDRSDIVKGASVEGRGAVRSLETGVVLASVDPDGIGAEVGLLPGDVLESINEEPVRDPIDFRFHMGDEEVVLEIRRGDDKLLIDIEKDADDDLGISLEEMPILRCDNKCVFCFLHQMPKGMRRTLYYQDDDYRLSFMHGAYVTLTNLTDEDFERIVDQRLNPMYISVHATDPDVRARLLGRNDPVDVLERIRFLASHGIQMHTQVVLCPGVNDGAVLKQTVFDLASHYPDVQSIGIVPLGLTRYRRNLPELTPVTPQVARTCVNQVAAWQETFRKRFGNRFAYLGDEFHLLSGEGIPSPEHYDGFPLVENGVGMVRRFMDDFENGFAGLERSWDASLEGTLVTSRLGEGFLRPMVARLNGLAGIDLKVVTVENRFFGEGITVSGLLTGADIGAALASSGPHAAVLLPPNCISHHGMFLDDLTPAGMSGNIGCPIVIGTYDLIESLQLLVEGRSRAVAGVAATTSLADDHPYISSHQIQD